MSSPWNRAPLRPELTALRARLAALVPTLESAPGWYGSVFFERKAARSFSANLKQTQVTDQVSMGAVLRIYDGYTLFEQATDELDEAALKATAQRLVGRARANAPASGFEARPYRPPTWAQRLAGGPLEAEIREQIPADVAASTPVHFGIRFLQSPVTMSASEHLADLKDIVERCKRLAPECGTELSFALARRSLSEEESIFVDRESNLSQTLLRLALTVVTMSGADRTYLRQGGLGGLEVTHVEDKDLRELLGDLAGLKTAQKLPPGKYRVLFGPVLSGVLAHEAFGHSQEGDTCARGRSKAWELHDTGTRVGNENATILNNPAIFQNGGEGYAAWGSYFFDEEGWLAREQVLLDRGVLRAPMTNLTSALRLGIPRTANGKRESWANGVYTRQTNTYFSAGERTLPELLAQLGDGFLAVHSAGGMEDPKGMGIQVGISFLQEIKGGKPTGRLFKGPAGGDIQLTGYTPDILNSIVAKSKIDAESQAPDRGRHPFNDAGGCGKYHKEFVFAGCGGPYMLLKDVTLG